MKRYEHHINGVELAKVRTTYFQLSIFELKTYYCALHVQKSLENNGFLIISGSLLVIECHYKG